MLNSEAGLLLLLLLFLLLVDLLNEMYKKSSIVLSEQK